VRSVDRRGRRGPVGGVRLSSGSAIGPYEIVAPLGAGGMGEVYRARDPRLRRDVAIKVLPATLTHDPDRLRRFELEARSAGMLNHPNVVTIYEIGSEDGKPYVVWELLEGETLRERLARGPIPGRKAIDYASQIVQGLAAAHEKGIVHRDLKPENIFVTREGRVKILDFGLAKASASEDRLLLATDGPTQTALNPETTPGTVMGTVGYMSPEQARGQPADARSDIFSFGAILYEILSGRRAFNGDSAVEMLSAILKDDPPDLVESALSLPPGLERIVRHCLEKAPEHRFQSTRDLAFGLDTLKEPTIVSSVAAAKMAPRAAPVSPRFMLAGAVVACALIAAAFFIGRLSRPMSDPPSFRRLTFRRGNLQAARFTRDGQLVYAARWDGRPMELFSSRLDGPESRSLGLPPAALLGVSAKDELAMALGFKLRSGTLARMHVGAAAPREILEDVEWADWSPDGQELAVVHWTEGRNRLEYPIGKVLSEAKGYLTDPRISPSGDKVAFIDHAVLGDTAGAVAVVDRGGRKTTLSAGWADAGGLAWSPEGREVWFTATRVGTSRAVHAVSLSGKVRLLARAAGELTLQDVSRKGSVMAVRADTRSGLYGVLRGDARERDLSWLDFSVAADLSADGSVLLFYESGEGGGEEYSIYVRRADSPAAAVRMGEGTPLALSPDGRWALATVGSPAQLVLLPVGTGQARPLGRPGLSYHARGAFFADGKRVLFAAHERERGTRSYVQELQGGDPEPVTPEGVLGVAVSPDGRLVAGAARDREFRLYPVDGGGEGRAIAGLDPEDNVIRWTADGHGLFVYRRAELPAKVFRLDLATGRKQLWKELMPADPAGVISVAAVLISADESSWIYNYRRVLADLYLLEGVR
jgi:eukaryotic-like serine/threonine-protein kinase